jgi:hypothetical protein
MSRPWHGAVHRLRANLVENWPIKLTALVLAAIVWAAVAAQEPTTQLVPVQLAITPPDGRSLVGEPPLVQALFAGTARELIKLYAEPPVIRQVLPDTITGAAYVLELSVADIGAIEGAAVSAQQIEPRSITIFLDEVSRRLVPVRHRVTIEADSGYLVFGDLTVSPSSLTVHGPQTLVATVDALYTVPLTLTAVTSSQRRRVAIDTTDLPSVQLSEDSVTVSAEVEALADRVFDGVRVTIDAQDGGEWTSDPVAVAVTVHGRDSRLALLTRDSIRVLASPPQGQSEAVVPLRIPPLPGIELRATPDSVMVRRPPRE